MARRKLRKRSRKRHSTLDELMGVGIVAGLLYLALTHLAGTSDTAAGYAALVVAGVLLGLLARPWADRVAKRFGYRIVRAKSARGGRR